VVPRVVAGLVSLVLVTGRGAAQSTAALPAIIVFDLRFDGAHANVLEPGDTAVVRAATSRLLETLRAFAGVTVADSARVAAAVAAEQADGDRCDNPCALRVGHQLGARWIAAGTLTKTSNLVWVFTAELLEVESGKALLADGYEIKGDATRMAPAGAHVFAQRVEKAISAR
jgi:TolB-like protein